MLSRAVHIADGTSLEDTSRFFQTLGASTFTSRILAGRVIVTRDPRNMRHVLTSASADFDASRDIRDHLFRDVTPHGILALDGAA